MDTSERVRAEFDRLVGPILRRNLPWWINPLNVFLGEAKFVEAIYLCNVVRVTLWNAYRKDHPEVDDEFGLLLVRSSHWTNAVVWMNSWYDLICQTVWLTLDLHGEDKNSPGWYKRALEKCNYENVKKKLGDGAVLKVLVEYRGSREFSLVHEWANYLKHRGVFDFEGLDLFQNFVGITWKKHGEIVLTEADIMPKKLSLEDGFRVVATAHRKAVDLMIRLEPLLFENGSESNLHSR